MSPVKVHFSSLSLGASVDQQTGNISIFDVVEEIRTPQVPIQLQALVISLTLEKTERDEFNGKLLIHFLTPDGRQALVGTGDMRIPAEQKRMKAVFRFGAFPIAHFGAHRFVLSLLDSASKKVGEVLLNFDVVQFTQVAQGMPSSEKPPISH